MAISLGIYPIFRQTHFFPGIHGPEHGTTSQRAAACPLLDGSVQLAAGPGGAGAAPEGRESWREGLTSSKHGKMGNPIFFNMFFVPTKPA